jgi:hypothetical protein
MRKRLDRQQIYDVGQNAVAGTGSAAGFARDFPVKKGVLSTCFFPPFTKLHVAWQDYGELTAAYGQSTAKGHRLESASVREPMQTYTPAGTIIFVSDCSPEAAVVQEIEAHGLRTLWARNIRTAVDLLNLASEKTVVVTHATTAELWWDALECGVEDILPAPLVASSLCRFLDKLFTP